MKKALSLILAIVMLCTMLAACGTESSSTPASSTPASSTPASSDAGEGEGEEETKIEGTIQYAFWGDELERQQKQEFCDNFTTIHPDATVEFVHIPSDYYLKLQTLAAAGDLPDVFGVTSQNVGRMAPVSMTLDDFIAKNQDLIGGLASGCLDAGKYDGSYYCLATTFDPYGMAINKDIFADAGVEIPADGWTMDDLEALLPQLTKVNADTGRTDYYALAVTVYNCDIYCFISNYGGEMFVDGKFCFSEDENTLKAITMLCNATANGYAPSPAITTSAGLDNERLFITGQIAMFPGGFWSINTFYGEDNSQCEFDWDWIDMPVQEGVEPCNPYVSGGSMVAADTENPDACYAFLAYGLMPEFSMSSYEAGLSMPGQKELYDPSLLPYGEDLTLDYFFRAADYRFPQSVLDMNATGKASECISVIYAELQLAYDGEQTPEQALKNIDDKCNEILTSEV